MTMTQLRATTPETLTPPPTVREPAPATGLCETCDGRSGCVLRAGAGRPVWECSEYADGPQVRRATRRASLADGADAAGDARGLCVNCDVLPGCTLRRPEHTVLRCEEYR